MIRKYWNTNTFNLGSYNPRLFVGYKFNHVEVWRYYPVLKDNYDYPFVAYQLKKY